MCDLSQKHSVRQQTPDEATASLDPTSINALLSSSISCRGSSSHASANNTSFTGSNPGGGRIFAQVTSLEKQSSLWIYKIDVHSIILFKEFAFFESLIVSYCSMAIFCNISYDLRALIYPRDMYVFGLALLHERTYNTCWYLSFILPSDRGIRS